MKTAPSVSRPQLKKTVTGTGFFCLAFGSMIGVGWITTLGDWLQPAGPVGAIAAFIAGGGLMLLIGLCYAELTPMMPVTGGEVAYAYRSLGTGKAFWVGWFLAFGYISVCAFEAVSIGIVSGYLLPGLDVVPLYTIHGYQVYLPHLVLAVFFTALIGWINYRGINVAIKFQVGLTALLVLCVSCFVVAGLMNGSATNLEPYFGSPDKSFSWADFWPGFLTVFVMAPFWFVGFDTIPQTAEEHNAPRLIKKLGLFIVWAIAGSTVFYVLVILAASLVSPWQSLVDQKLPTAAAFRSAFESDWLANLVLTAGLIGLLTSWNGFFIAGTRVLFALGRGHIIGSSFGQVHPQHGTPTKAIWFCSIVTALGACLGKGALIAFIDVGSFCIAFAFLGVSLSLLKLRNIAPDMERPYRLPFGKTVAILAAAGSLLILLALLIPGSP
ncbi:MAG: APC family permease, partial [Planctomycetota bacterium]|nr:APC family permease [Planctomycetota bacterium]